MLELALILLCAALGVQIEALSLTRDFDKKLDISFRRISFMPPIFAITNVSNSQDLELVRLAVADAYQAKEMSDGTGERHLGPVTFTKKQVEDAPAINRVAYILYRGIEQIARQASRAGTLAVYPVDPENAYLPNGIRLLPMAFERPHNDNKDMTKKKILNSDDDEDESFEVRKRINGRPRASDDENPHTVATAIAFLHDVEPHEGGYIVFPYLEKTSEDAYEYHGVNDYLKYECKDLDTQCATDARYSDTGQSKWCCCRELLRVQPRKGEALLFFTVDARGKKEGVSLHLVCPSMSPRGSWGLEFQYQHIRPSDDERMIVKEINKKKKKKKNKKSEL